MAEREFDLRDGLNGGWLGAIRKLKRVKTAEARDKILKGLEATKMVDVSMEQIYQLLTGENFHGKKE